MTIVTRGVKAGSRIGDCVVGHLTCPVIPQLPWHLLGQENIPSSTLLTANEWAKAIVSQITFGRNGRTAGQFLRKTHLNGIAMNAFYFPFGAGVNLSPVLRLLVSFVCPGPGLNLAFKLNVSLLLSSLSEHSWFDDNIYCPEGRGGDPFPSPPPNLSFVISITVLHNAPLLLNYLRPPYILLNNACRPYILMHSLKSSHYQYLTLEVWDF